MEAFFLLGYVDKTCKAKLADAGANVKMGDLLFSTRQ